MHPSPPQPPGGSRQLGPLSLALSLSPQCPLTHIMLLAFSLLRNYSLTHSLTSSVQCQPPLLTGSPTRPEEASSLAAAGAAASCADGGSPTRSREEAAGPNVSQDSKRRSNAALETRSCGSGGRESDAASIVPPAQ
eukprot:GHVU01094304.1.p1 GENE.GHVU01094304.1~~GHVU01094304.1.p1  ORF type:complete len:136 (-),score=13.09 GHVU01094304.1:322-729(-)